MLIYDDENLKEDFTLPDPASADAQYLGIGKPTNL